MKTIPELNLNPEEIYGSYGVDWYEPLLKYVELVAEKYKPVNLDEKENGFTTSTAITTFAYRYLNGKVGKKAMLQYSEDIDLLDTIELLGYDIDKFWYLLMFIYDYSCGFCKKGIKMNESPKEQLTNFFEAILKNATMDESKQNIEKPIKIVLEIEGKRKITIDKPKAVLYLASVLSYGLEEIEAGSILTDKSIAWRKKQNKLNTQNIDNIQDDPDQYESDELPNPVFIWYFANMFLTFFKLIPPVKSLHKKNPLIKRDKILLISNLICLVEPTINHHLSQDRNLLKGYLSNYKGSKLNRMNRFYVSFQ